MTTEFKEDQIASREKWTREPYIGYFSPNGKLVDYNILLGENCHDSWQNPVSWAFLSWVSYIVSETSIEELKKWAISERSIANNKYSGLAELVVRGYGINYDFNYESFDEFLGKLYHRINEIENCLHKYGRLDEYTEFEYKLLLFFRNAYNDKKFFDTIQRKIVIENPSIVKEKIKHEYGNFHLPAHILDSMYHKHLQKELLSYMKDICVQYLGYDSLERFSPNGRELKIPYWPERYNFELLSPRTITSSYPNINERYYNYLLMDWTVKQLPRYYYNEHTRIYEKSDFNILYQSETEEKLEQEIKSIKKLVPLKERKQYFR